MSASTSLIDLYDRLANAPDDRTRARVIAEAFEMLEVRYPHLPDLATRQNLSETELKLIREIELVRRETEQVRAELKVDIERVRAELIKEIEQVRAQTERVRANILAWSFVFWASQFAAIMALLWRLWPLAGG